MTKKTSFRNYTCGELTKEHTGKEVKLVGFADSVRTHGKIGFINLRDRYGTTQLFFKGLVRDNIENLRKESILQIFGKVSERPENLINKDMVTGEIEVVVSKINILNDVPELPLQLDGKATEDTKLKYRYLDLRMPEIQKNIILRHKIIKSIRDFLDKEDFLEVETPILAKSTPEGARDYLVPSRINKGNFFALPQSPQLFKQLLMVGGYDRYFQIAKCFRDEDLRADRQPEFTQLDFEMSFVNEEDVFSVFEKMLKHVWKEVLNIDLKVPFDRLTHKEAMEKHKSDKPDLRKDGEKFKFLWVTEFPLFEWNEEAQRHISCHHPFTSVHEDDIDKLGKSYDIRSNAYDLVLNGWEMGSGSVRIHDSELQSKIFKELKLTEEEAKQKFGFFMDALKFAPPHAGFAIGLDRLVALAAGCDSIRDVIAFPKNKFAKDVMMDAPGKVDKDQLDTLGLNLK